MQRVTSASVSVEGERVSSIEAGMLLLVGITHADTATIGDQLAAKCANLRIFDDEDGVMNRSLLDLIESDALASVLAVSQFTLYADCRKGRRPSYVGAAPPELAEPLFDQFVETLKKFGIPTRTGRFGAEMSVELINDGPVTIWLDSNDLRRDM